MEQSQKTSEIFDGDRAWSYRILLLISSAFTKDEGSQMLGSLKEMENMCIRTF